MSAAPRLGSCLDLEILAPVVVLSGGATAIWTPTDSAHGTWNVTFPPGGSCGGENDTPYASAYLLLNGCGQVKVSASGNGSGMGGQPWLYAQAVSTLGAPLDPGIIHLQSGTGSSPCDSEALTPVGDSAADLTWQVNCGCYLSLEFACFYNDDSPECTASFEIEIVS